MSKQRKTGQSIMRIEMSEKPIPSFSEKEVVGVDWVRWGDDNKYPEFLISLYETSAYHNSLVSGKADMIVGGGFKINMSGLTTSRVAVLKSLIDQPESEENLNTVLEAVALDLELFSGFCLAVTWDVKGESISIIEHRDIDDYRWSKDGEKLYYSDDWSKSMQSLEKTGLKEVELFDSKKKKGTQILYYKEPAKKAKVYPKPAYMGAIRSIATDVEISNFDYNTLVNGFVGGTMITFTDGKPTLEEERKIEAKLKKKHTGTDNANGVVLNFVDDKDRAPVILQLSGNDLDKRYAQLDERNQQKIFSAHKVTSPMLFGIKTAGQLGGRDEIETAAEIFQNRYVSLKQDRILRVFNSLLEVSGFNRVLTIEPATIVNKKQEPVKAKLHTHEDPILVELKAKGRKRTEFKNVERVRGVKDSNHALVSECELSGQNLKLQVTTLGSTILGIIQRNPLINILGISALTGENIANTANEIEALKVGGYLSIDDSGSLDVTDKTAEEAQKSTVEVLYSYEVREGFGEPIIDTTRDFCAELVSLENLYTREEIEEISSIVDRDVWTYRGGFYRNPDSGETTPHCRHEWVQNVVTNG